MIRSILLAFIITFIIISPVFAVENPCPDDQFLDPIDQTCQPLLGIYPGYDPGWESTIDNEINLTDCTESAFNTALQQASQQNGTIINLPACTITLRTGNQTGVPGTGPWTLLPSNTILQGAGQDQTILVLANATGQFVGTKGARNIAIRDLTIDGNRTAHNNIYLMYANNLLFERITSRNGIRGQMYIKSGQDITIRYSQFLGDTQTARADHGIAINDCRPEIGKAADYNYNFDNGIGTVEEQIASPNLDLCQAEYNYWVNIRQPIPDIKTPRWTRNILIYSSLMQHNGGYALDTHESDMEITGNRLYDSYNQYPTKFMDTQNVYYYRNHFKDSRIGTFQGYTKYNIPERTLANNWLINNTFENTGSLYFWMGWNYGGLLAGEGMAFTPYQDLYLINNSINQTKRAVNKVGTIEQSGNDAGFASADKLHICQGSDDQTKVDYFNPPGILDYSICQQFASGYYDFGGALPVNPTDQCQCTQQYDPVCGADGQTYSNNCHAQCAGVESTPGACTPPSQPLTVLDWISSLLSQRLPLTSIRY